MKNNNAIWTLALALSGVGGSLPVMAGAADQPLTTASAVRSLSAAAAEQQVPVKLRGVVTFYDDGLFSRFLQDDTAGIYLEVTNSLGLHAGQLVEVEGVTGPGEFAPVVRPTAVKIVGDGKIPAAKPVSAQDLLGGAEDSQMVEISGTVRTVKFDQPAGNYFVDLVMGSERFTVVARQLPAGKPEELLGATLRVRGVCATLFNRQRQLFGFRLLAPTADALAVLAPAPANPFDQAPRPIDSLLRFTPQGLAELRVKVTGTVVFFQPGSAVFIQDASHGLHCETSLREPLRPGDRVEVLGTPAKGEYTPILEDALYRKVGTEVEPKPEVVDLKDMLTGIYDCRLVQISARVLERVDRGVNQFLLLEAGDFIFQAYLPQGAIGDRLTGLVHGSEVRVTGICLIERGNSWQAGKDWRIKSFHLLLRSPQDVQVVQLAQAASQSSPESWLLILGALELVVLVVLIRLAMFAKKQRAAAK